MPGENKNAQLRTPSITFLRAQNSCRSRGGSPTALRMIFVCAPKDTTFPEMEKKMEIHSAIQVFRKRGVSRNFEGPE